jgi:SAM-dependent methyltransferase
MGDVFGAALGDAGQFLRDAAVAAAHELGVFSALSGSRTTSEGQTLDELAKELGVAKGVRRLRALVELLAGIGMLSRHVCDGAVRFAVAGEPPSKPDVPKDGWGQLADVIRTNKALDVPGGEQELRMHAHLAEAGAAAARELFEKLREAIAVGSGGNMTLLDLGGGAGAYTAAFLEVFPNGGATIVDYAEVIALARTHLARFGGRVRFIVSDVRTIDTPSVGAHDIVLLANVLHLHDERACAQLCAIAARAVKPGGRVVVKDLRIDDDRGGPVEGLLFALNMAVYTGGGDVYSAAQIRAWLEAAGIEGVEERRLDIAPDAFAIVGRRASVQSEVAIESEMKAIASRLSRVGKIAWRELEAAGKLREDARPRHLVFPNEFGRTLAKALVTAREEGRADQEAAMEAHYLETLPRLRVAQIVGSDEPAATFMHAELDWAQLPRMSAAMDRLFDVLGDADVDAARVMGTATANAFRAGARTFGELFMQTHYGACMPLLYGYPGDLAYFAARGRERGESVLATMDRYLVAPLVHELCHFGRERGALPTHLDECVGGWLGVHVWPEFAVPDGERDDAIPYAPLLAQVGQAFARAFDVKAIVRAQSGAVPWRDVLGERVLAMVERICDEDWRRMRTLHFLSDTTKPRPWVALALAAGAGHALETHTVQSLAELPIGTLALRPDEAIDRAIVRDAICAMCLETSVVDGSLRTRFVLPNDAIRVDARACRVTCGEAEYWFPPEVAGRILAANRPAYQLRLASRAAIPEAVAAICEASAGMETGGFSLVVA